MGPPGTWRSTRDDWSCILFGEVHPAYLGVSVKEKMVPQMLQSQRIPKQQKPKILGHTSL